VFVVLIALGLSSVYQAKKSVWPDSFKFLIYCAAVGALYLG